MTDSILTERCRTRMAALSAADQLAAERAALGVDEHIQLVERLLAERRQKAERRKQPRMVATDRRGRNPQRHGWEDQSDIALALAADALPPTTPKE